MTYDFTGLSDPVDEEGGQWVTEGASLVIMVTRRRRVPDTHNARASARVAVPDLNDCVPSPTRIDQGGVREGGLTRREAEVIGLIVQGFSNAEIAEQCRVSINSVKSYIRSAYRRIEVGSRSQAIGWGVRHGFSVDGPREAQRTGSPRRVALAPASSTEKVRRRVRRAS